MKKHSTSRTAIVTVTLFLSGVAVANLPFAEPLVARAAAAFLTAVSHDASLAGDGTAASPLGVANNGVATAQLATNAVTSPKIAPGQVVKSLNGLSDGVTLAAGSNVSLDLTGQTLTISSLLGLTSVFHDATLTGNGTNASPLAIAEARITSEHIASGQVVKALNNMTDGVTLVGGPNITVTPTGSRTLTIAADLPQKAHLNPLRIATLQWYEANRTGVGLSLGQRSDDLVFDGAHMWTSVNWSVIKFRPSDAAIVGTFTNPTDCTGPMAFDGANIWVGTCDDPFILKFRASDGALLGTFRLASRTVNMAFNGDHIWATSGQRLSKIQPSDGTILDVINFSGTPVSGVAADGNGCIWASLSNGTSNGAVVKVRASDSAILGVFEVGISPFRLAFDGENIWVANYGSNTVSKLRSSDGANLGNFNVGGGPFNLAFDGQNIWVVNVDNNSVSKLRAEDGALLKSFFNIGTNLKGIAFDGANIWVTHSAGLTKL